MNKYTSSIINKYGDRDNVPRDCKTLFDIIGRQGNSLLIDCIAETCGTTANQFKLSDSDRKNVIKKMLSELEEALKERL